MDAWLAVFTWCDWQTLLTCEEVCQDWLAAIRGNDVTLWRPHVRQVAPEIDPRMLPPSETSWRRFFGLRQGWERIFHALSRRHALPHFTTIAPRVIPPLHVHDVPFSSSDKTQADEPETTRKIFKCAVGDGDMEYTDGWGGGGIFHVRSSPLKSSKVLLLSDRSGTPLPPRKVFEVDVATNTHDLRLLKDNVPFFQVAHGWRANYFVDPWQAWDVRTLETIYKGDGSAGDGFYTGEDSKWCVGDNVYGKDLTQDRYQVWKIDPSNGRRPLTPIDVKFPAWARRSKWYLSAVNENLLVFTRNWGTDSTQAALDDDEINDINNNNDVDAGNAASDVPHVAINNTRPRPALIHILRHDGTSFASISIPWDHFSVVTTLLTRFHLFVLVRPPPRHPTAYMLLYCYRLAPELQLVCGTPTDISPFLTRAFPETQHISTAIYWTASEDETRLVFYNMNGTVLCANVLTGEWTRVRRPTRDKAMAGPLWAFWALHSEVTATTAEKRNTDDDANVGRPPQTSRDIWEWRWTDQHHVPMTI
ncbi:hypothetical protein HK102_006237 [Quaeritorhiza haematococci]|nr:hypothetical protein HK102_006237 [Quaeritorhiza haematococci]